LAQALAQAGAAAMGGKQHDRALAARARAQAQREESPQCANVVVDAGVAAHTRNVAACATAAGQSADPRHRHAQEAFDLARNKKFRILCAHVDVDPRILNLRNVEGQCLMHWAAFAGRKSFIKKALALKRVPIDLSAKNGQTPLMWACIAGKEEAARLLLDNGASLRARDSLGATPALLCVKNGKVAPFLLALKRGGLELLQDTDTNICGATHWAAFRGDCEFLRLLNYFGANFSARDGQGMRALHRAAYQKRMDACKYLIQEHGQDPSEQDGRGRDCFQLVGREDLAEVLRRSRQQSSARSPKASLMSDRALPLIALALALLAPLSLMTELWTVAWERVVCASSLFTIIWPLALGGFAWLSFSNPGIVCRRAHGESAVEELMDAIDKGDNRMPEDSESSSHSTDVNRLCTHTWILKGPRVRYCDQIGSCVEDLDHFDPWLNNAVGRMNHHMFVILVACEFMVEIISLWICMVSLGALVPNSTLLDWLFTIVTSCPLTTLTVLAHSFLLPLMAIQTSVQFWLISHNLVSAEAEQFAKSTYFWKLSLFGYLKATGPCRLGRVLPWWLWLPPLVSARLIRPEEPWCNPFDKGSCKLNWEDFWFQRHRADVRAIFPKLF